MITNVCDFLKVIMNTIMILYNVSLVINSNQKNKHHITVFVFNQRLK